MVKNVNVLSDGSFALDKPDYVNSRSLAANTAEDISIPDDATHVFFSATGDFYVEYDGTDAVVPGDIDDGTANELNPTVRFLANSGDSRTLSVISESAIIITAAFYRQ